MRPPRFKTPPPAPATPPGWEKSAPGWLATIDAGEVNRIEMLDEPMVRLAGDVRGKDVVDIGCGEGRFCRMLSERGARTTGVEPTETLVAAARNRHPRGTYLQARGEQLPLPEASADLAVFYLSLIDIEDFRAAVTEAARVVRPGGGVIVANLQSFATTRTSAWYRNDRGEKLHVAVEEYFTERGIRTMWDQIDIVNYHRPLAAYMTAFMEAGFVLTAYEEPQASADSVRRHPRMKDERMVPLFYVMAWRRA